MNETELIKSFHEMNEYEIFYRSYQKAKEDNESLKRFLNSLDIEDCINKHLIIPEIIETMPNSMKDEFFFNQNELGIKIQKHNCYSPEFEHFHSYFEGLYVYEGTCKHTVNGKKATLKMGDFYLLPPGTRHSIYVGDQSVVLVMIIRVNVIENTFKNPIYYKKNKLADFFTRNFVLSSSNNFLMFHTGNDSELKSLLLKIILESNNQYTEYDAMIYAYFSLFFASLLRYYESTIEIEENIAKNDNLAFELFSFIKNNYATCTLEEVANKFHYTSEYTSKFIKETTGKTFTSILIEARMEKAAILLKETSMAIADIAYDVGYGNTESLIRAFKNYYKATPLEYRRFLNSTRNTR